MINFEKYKSKIKGLMSGHYSNFGFNNMSSFIERTSDKKINFWSDIFDWGLEEWKPKLSEIDKFILEHMGSKYEYIARDKNGSLSLYDCKLEKESNYWKASTIEGEFLVIDYTICKMFEVDQTELFSFVKWEDEKPWSIDELRELVKEDDTDGNE